MANGSQGARAGGFPALHTGPRGDGSESVEENWKRSVSAGGRGSVGKQGCSLLENGWR
jgi:hypothetical protein